MARYFRVTYKDCFGRENTALVATNEENPGKDTRYAWSTGFNGCKLTSYEEINQEAYRRGKV